MRPLYLSLEGINSFTTLQELDFTTVAANNIFCIYGATGAGKTTVLDSIIIALFGKGERVDRTDEYINLSSNAANIVFEFEFENRRYRIRRTIKRKGIHKAQVEDMDTGEILCDKADNVNEFISNLIGLKRSEFTQVVILEQGKFSKFLKADKRDRVQTVSRLFNLERFSELQKRFNSLHAFYKDEREKAVLEIAPYAECTSKNIAEQESKNKELSLQLEKLSQSNKLTDKRLLSLSQDKANYDSLVYAKKGFDAAKELLKGLNDKLDLTLQKMSQIDAQKSAYESAKINIENAQKQLVKISAAIELTAKKNELVSQREIIKKSYLQSKERLQILRQNADDFRLKIDAKKCKLDGEIEYISSLVQFNLSEPLSELKLLGSEFAAYQRAAKEQENEIDSINKQLQLTISEYEKKCSLWQVNTVQRNNTATLIHQQRQQCEKLKGLQAQYIKSNAACVVANSLHSGDKCPVCGGEFSGKADNNCDAKNADNADYSVQIDKAEKLLAELLDKDKKIAAMEAVSLTETESLKKRQQELKTLLLKAQSKKTDERFLSILDANEFLSRVNNAIAYSSDIAFLAKELEKVELLRNSMETEFAKIESEGKAKKQEIDNFNAQIESFGGLDIEQEQKTVNAVLLENKQFVAMHEETAARLAQEQTSIKISIAAATAEKQSCQNIIEKFSHLTFDESQYNSLIAEKNAADERLRELATILGAENSKLEKLISGEPILKELNKKIKQIEKQEYNAKILSELCARNKFLEYVQEEYIMEFTQSASQKLSELSCGKYTLCYEPSEGNFFVEDFLRGNEKRKVRTLSGGETFLASVSMAVAISEMIAKNRNLDFFFLDEGFGTLDSDSIDIVTNALYSLCASTMVGVVSHRSELVQSIASKVQIVAATDSKGSQIITE